MRNHLRRESQSTRCQDERFVQPGELTPEERLQRIANLLLKAIRLKLIGEKAPLVGSTSPQR